jgi:hypothetical protein
MSEAANPYAAPAARVEDVAVDPEAERIRREHISHEASIKAVGILYYIGAVLMAVGAITSLMGATQEPAAAGVMVLLLAVGAGEFAAGWGVRGLKPWGRIVGCVLSGLGLLAFPIGTLINAYILYLFLSKKGRTIFAPEYQQVIAATPHVKYKVSIVVWIFLALLIGLLVVGLGVAVIGGK